MDEETFFHSPRNRRHRGLHRRWRRCASRRRALSARTNWNIYAAQASDGDNTAGDNATTVGAADARRSCRSASTTPISRSAATIRARHAAASRAGRPICGGPTRSMSAAGAPMAMRKVRHRRDIYPVFRELFAKKRDSRERTDAIAGMKASARMQRRRTACCSKAPTGTSARCQRIHERSRRSPSKELGLDIYPNQIEVITRRADARRLCLDRHAAVLQALVLRQALRAQRGAVPQGHAGARLRDRHQLRPLHRPTSWRRTRRRCRRW